MIFLHFLFFASYSKAAAPSSPNPPPANTAAIAETLRQQQEAARQQQADLLLQSQVQFLEQQTLQQRPPTLQVQQDKQKPQISVLTSMTAANEQAYSAIERCETQRVNGLLKNHQISAKCASKKITLAFKRADYPYMDLIKQLTDKYLQIAQEVDTSRINEEDANSQIAEFINRMNTEERNRSLKVN